jgi:hypothetical protein
MKRYPVAEKIEINPGSRTAPLGTSRQTAIKRTCPILAGNVEIKVEQRYGCLLFVVRCEIHRSSGAQYTSLFFFLHT